MLPMWLSDAHWAERMPVSGPQQSLVVRELAWSSSRQASLCLLGSLVYLEGGGPGAWDLPMVLA